MTTQFLIYYENFWQMTFTWYYLSGQGGLNRVLTLKYGDFTYKHN